jgi:hypothetical protein
MKVEETSDGDATKHFKDLVYKSNTVVTIK